MIKRRSPAFLGFLTVGILIIVGASLWSILVRGSTPAPVANAVAVAPIFSEEVVFSKLPPGPTVRSDPALTLLEEYLASGERSIKQFLADHGAMVLFDQDGDDGLFWNINTPQDLAAAEARMKNTSTV